MAHRGQADALRWNRPDSSGSATHSSLPRTAAVPRPGGPSIVSSMFCSTGRPQPLQLLLDEACLAARSTCQRTPPAPLQNGEAVAINDVPTSKKGARTRRTLHGAFLHDRSVHSALPLRSRRQAVDQKMQKYYSTGAYDRFGREVPCPGQ